METFEIEGQKPLGGRIVISGAKNEALKIIPLAVLINQEIEVLNVPDIADIKKQLEIFKSLGGIYKFRDGVLKLDGTTINSSELDPSLASSLRSSVVYMGPLLGRFKRVKIAFPGGCAIGRRPIDTHLKAFKDLGAKILLHKESVELSFDQFSSKCITLNEQSVTATENVFLFLSNFDEEFEVKNCAIEPEIIALIDELNKSGAQIEQIAERDFRVKGNSDLKIDKISIIPDRIEAFSYLVAFLVTGGEGVIENFPHKYMKVPLELLKDCGAKIETDGNLVKVFKTDKFNTFNLKTEPYPGFPTDMQSPMSLIATLADGDSTINEAMFENRLGYIAELSKMGLKAEIKSNHVAVISGKNDLVGSEITSLDLRSGITLVIAALMAQGKSVIKEGQIIERGYENIVQKLKSAGAKIEKYD